LAATSLRSKGLEGFAHVVGIADAWLQRYWSDVHPRLEEDIDGAIPRRSALESFADQYAIVQGLLRVRLVHDETHGPVTALDLTQSQRYLAVWAEQESDDAHPASQFAPHAVAAALDSMSVRDFRRLRESLVSAAAALRRLVKTMRRQSPDTQPLSFDQLLSILVEVERALAQRLTDRPALMQVVAPR
jgi:hypothetical protein